MRRRPFEPAEGVSNIELFYDLIFVYGISVLTSLCQDITVGFFDRGTWLTYLFCLLVILQIWFYTTVLMNRYGDRSSSECVGLFVNMFLLYFLANGAQADGSYASTHFNLIWAAILINIAVQWIIKVRVYTNLDRDDMHIMAGSIVTLLAQAVIATVAAFLPTLQSVIVSWVALVFGMTVWVQAPHYRKKTARFSHVAERCSLLTIIAFGEMIVAISTFMTRTTSIWYSVGVFTLVVGLFLIYIFEHDHMLDHHAKTDGMAYMTISSWLIVVIGNLTVAVSYMPRDEIDFLPKSIYLSVCLVLYLLTSFLLGRFNKVAYRYSKLYVIGRLAACAAIVIVGLLTRFDPDMCLRCHVLAVYAAFGYEFYLWRRRSKLVAIGRSLGMDCEEMVHLGYDFTTIEGRRSIEQTARDDE